MVGFAYGVPFGLPRAFVPYINPARASPARWSRIPSACCVSALSAEDLFVWIVSTMTVTKVVEGCVYIRRRYYGIMPRVGGEFEHSALSPISLSRSVL